MFTQLMFWSLQTFACFEHIVDGSQQASVHRTLVSCPAGCVAQWRDLLPQAATNALPLCHTKV